MKNCFSVDHSTGFVIILLSTMGISMHMHTCMNAHGDYSSNSISIVALRKVLMQLCLYHDISHYIAICIYSYIQEYCWSCIWRQTLNTITWCACIHTLKLQLCLMAYTLCEWPTKKCLEIYASWSVFFFRIILLGPENSLHMCSTKINDYRGDGEFKHFEGPEKKKPCYV